MAKKKSTLSTVFDVEAFEQEHTKLSGLRARRRAVQEALSDLTAARYKGPDPAKQAAAVEALVASGAGDEDADELLEDLADAATFDAVEATKLRRQRRVLDDAIEKQGRSVKAARSKAARQVAEARKAEATEIVQDLVDVLADLERIDERWTKFRKDTAVASDGDDSWTLVLPAILGAHAKFAPKVIEKAADLYDVKPNSK